MENREERVVCIFNRISKNYDAANTRISFGMQARWKKYLVRYLADILENGASVLDVCCGSGDIALALAGVRPDLQIVGMDFSANMLEIARSKCAGTEPICWKQGNAMALPFPDGCFSATVISFGLRNTKDYQQTLEEMMRVTKRNGWICCLDSFVPDSPFVRIFYELYFRKIMPLIGGGFKYYRDYLWLWQSTNKFLRKKELLQMFQSSGLRAVGCRSFLFGACALHRGQKAK